MNEVPRPHMILAQRAIPHDAVVRTAQTPLLSLFSRHFETLAPPLAVDALAVHFPTFRTQHGPHAPITVSRMGSHEFVHLLYQHRLVVAHLRCIALRRARLPNSPTHAPLRGVELFAQTRRHLATPRRAYRSPLAIPLSMALSSDKSATSFLSRAFSISNSLSRLASSAFMPPY